MREESLFGLRDTRVRAIVAMAPPGIALFPPSGVAGFDVPTLLVQGDRDEVLKYPNNAGYLKSILGPRAEYRIVPGEHLVFMSINPKQLEDVKDDETKALRATHEIIENFLARVLAP